MRRTISVLAFAGTLAMVSLPLSAFADAVYPSEHITLMPVGDQPLRTGFVENIHANGPVVFAMERYVLNAASPSTTYDVALNIWFDPTCPGSVPDLPLEGISFATNGVGNGVGMARFAPADAGPPGGGLHGLTVGIVWTLSIHDTGTLAYTTACEVVTLD